eukprot:scaffold218910_cov16-Tisochrysis_lutea.AAC.1
MDIKRDEAIKRQLRLGEPDNPNTSAPHIHQQWTYFFKGRQTILLAAPQCSKSSRALKPALFLSPSLPPSFSPHMRAHIHTYAHTLLCTHRCGIPRITHVKVIAQIDKIESLGEHPHRMFYKGGGLAVTEDLRQ